MSGLNTYEITWHDRSIGPTYRADGTLSSIERNNIEATDEAEARDLFDAFFGHINYEIISVQEYQGSEFAQWMRSRVQ